MEVYVYHDINEVPIKWRTLKSARLSLQQINDIMADAYDHTLATQTDEGQTIKIPDFGGARQRFTETHEIEEGFWVKAREQ
jgi:hypothetical protein